MNKITMGALSAFVLIMTGCTTMPIPQQNNDKEPMLVGRPVADRIQDTKIEIYDQLTLLQKIQSGEKVGTYNVVTHNNELDARRGSDMTLPQAYAKSLDLKKKEEENKLKKVVKKIEWKNNSLNKLAENMAKAIDYNIVVKDGKVSDINITLVAENKTIQEIVEQLQKDLEPFAEIVVIPQNKTFNVIYK